MKPFAQVSQLDTNKIRNTFLIGLNNSFAFSEFKNFNDPNTTTSLVQIAITLTPRIGIFLNNHLVLGMQWRYGWYWSNFNKTFPNLSSTGPFIEYYFTKFKMYKWNTIKFKEEVKAYLHPYINVGYNFKNFYSGFDSYGNRGAIFNGSNTNQSVNGLVGINFSTKRRINFNVAFGLQYSNPDVTLLQNTKLIKLMPISEIGVASYLHKKKK